MTLKISALLLLFPCVAFAQIETMSEESRVILNSQLRQTARRLNAIEGGVSLTTGVTGVLPLANGGSQSALSDPGANSVFYWNESLNKTVLTSGPTLDTLRLSETTAPTTAASEGALYTKDTGGQPELFYREESSGDEVQVTNAGKLNNTHAFDFDQSASFSAVDSITITETISAGDVYKLVIEGTVATADFDGAFRFNGDSTGGDYRWGWYGKSLATGSGFSDISDLGDAEGQAEVDNIVNGFAFHLVAYVTARLSKSQISWELRQQVTSSARLAQGIGEYDDATPTSINIVRLSGTGTITGRWYLYKLKTALP